MNNEFRFTGQQRDPETEFYYLRARYYDPVTGRFMTPDPVRGCATGPDGNPYIYAMNQPDRPDRSLWEGIRRHTKLPASRRPSAGTGPVWRPRYRLEVES